MRYRIGCLVIGVFLIACANEKAPEESENNFNYGQFSEQFETVSLPFILTDTALLNNKDTSQIRDPVFTSLVPDSIKNKLFGKNSKVRYIPLFTIKVPDAETYYIVKATAGSKKTALLFSFDKEHQFGAVFPFLVPDADASTVEMSSIDKAFSISRTVLRKLPDDVIAEGKDVYVYNNDARQFTLIMTDVLDEETVELINPIDTLSSSRKWTGDYIKDKQNLVSVRDGRRSNTLTVFVHFEKKKGECTGELKGEAEITGPNVAVYSQAGDPCVLQFSFSTLR